MDFLSTFFFDCLILSSKYEHYVLQYYLKYLLWEFDVFNIYIYILPVVELIRK